MCGEDVFLGGFAASPIRDDPRFLFLQTLEFIVDSFFSQRNLLWGCIHSLPHSGRVARRYGNADDLGMVPVELGLFPRSSGLFSAWRVLLIIIPL